MSKKSKDIQQMVDMLKQGATLTELACPACASPLFRFKSGELWCVKCEKRVIVLREGENGDKVTGRGRLTSLENTLLKKIEAVEKKIREEDNVEKLHILNAALTSLLENLEKLKRITET